MLNSFPNRNSICGSLHDGKEMAERELEILWTFGIAN